MCLQVGQGLLQALGAQRRGIQPGRLGERQKFSISLAVSRHRQAQRIVMAHQLTQVIHQLGPANAGWQAQDHPLVPVLRAGERLLEEPALDRLQREVPTQQPLLAPDLRHFSRRGQHAAQSPHRPGLENLSHAAGKARVAQACGQLNAENGVATGLEEIAFHAQRLLQYALPDFQDARFPLIVRRHQGVARHQLHRRQARQVQFAVGRQRQSLQQHQLQRDHVFGQTPGHVLQDDVGFRRRLPRSNRSIGHQRLTLPVAGDHHLDLLQRRATEAQLSFDLAGLDAVAAQLDLLVETAQVFVFAIGQQPGTITGVIKPQAHAGHFVFPEDFGGTFRLVQVAPCEPEAGQAQLTGNADRAQAAMRVQHQRLHAIDGRADGQPIASREGLGQRRDGRLGGTVHVDQPKLAGPALGNGCRAGFATEADRLHRRQRSRRQGRQQGRGENHLGGPGAFDLVQQPFPRLGPAQAGAMGERHQCAHVAGVERQRHAVQHAIAWCHIQAPSMVAQQVGQCAVLDHHALRQPGRTGGVDDLGEALRVMWQSRCVR